MKRVSNLFDSFASFANLHLAWRKARRGTRQNLESAGWTYNLERNLLDLRDRLLSGEWTPHPYRYFEIYDPKQRTISVAVFEDRVVHHALVAVLEPIYERSFHAHSYATRKGKGAHAAARHAQAMLRQNRWFFKSDVEKYFDSIDQNILLGLLHNKIRDQRLLEIAGRIVRNGGSNGKGLPIGNLTSQFLANVYLHPFDCFVQRELGFNAYVRYMDDFVLFHPEKDKLKTARPALEDFLRERLQLRLKPSATYLNSASNGLSFLGLRIFPGIIRLRPENSRRMMRRWRQKEKAWQCGEMEEDKCVAATNSYWAVLNAYPTAGLRRALLKVV